MADLDYLRRVARMLHWNDLNDAADEIEALREKVANVEALRDKWLLHDPADLIDGRWEEGDQLRAALDGDQ